MKVFYGLIKGTLWYVSETMPEKASYIVIHAETIQDAEIKLFAITNEHNPRIYL